VIAIPLSAVFDTRSGAPKSQAIIKSERARTRQAHRRDRDRQCRSVDRAKGATSRSHGAL